MIIKTIIFCVSYILIQVTSFNLFPKYADVFTSQSPNSYFGYSILLRKGIDESHIIVGAPKANSTFTSLHGSIVEPGAVFTCSFTTQNCSQFLFDPNGNTLHRAPNGMTYFHKKDHAWLGGSLAGEDTVGGLLVACAPRWINQIYRDIYYLQNGLCYVLKETTNIERTAEELIPLVYAGNQGFKNGTEHVYYYALGEAGMSAQFTKDNEILLGAPGVLQWKGMVIKYYNSAASPGIISQKSKGRNGNFDDFVSPNPFFISKIEDFSYFGYAVSSGKFLQDSNDIWYVGGAPRGKNLLGQVLVYEYVKYKNELVIHFEMNGRQQGEYFGAAITVVDINNDTTDDIVVGSPMYSTDRFYDMGCLYIFLNNGKGIFSRSIIDGPQMSKIRFGTSISNIGDINQDGYSDIAVGAPYYNDDRGAIFIFLGSRKGLEETYSQRILAEDVNPSLRGFGISISKGIDIDSNYYPDIGVGAYLSGHAAVIKTKPVVKIQALLSSSNKRISIDTKSFNISACVQYDGAHVPTSLTIKMKIIADPFYKRVYFTENRGGMWTFTKTVREKMLQCEDFNVTVSSIQSDFTQPIEFQMSYELDESSSTVGRFCNTCPILDNREQTITYLNIPFQINCGDDNICQPDLKLNARFRHDRPYFVLGSEKQIDVTVTIENLGEPAFLCNVFVTVPEEIPFEKISTLCQKLTDQVLICSMGNPLATNETKSLTLGLDVSSLTISNLLEVIFNVSSVGNEENLLDNNVTLNMPLKTEATLSVVGMSDPEQFTFVDENEQFKQDKFTFHQKFSIENLGPSLLPELELNFLIPHKFNYQAENLLEIFEPEVTLEDNFFNCTLFNTEGYYTDEENDKPIVITGDDFIKPTTRTKRSETNLKENIPSNEVSNLRQQTDEFIIPAWLPLNRTLIINCMSGDSDVYCFSIKCISGPIKRLQSPTIVQLKMMVNLKVIDQIRGEKDIIVLSSSVQPVSQYISMNTTYAHMILLGSLRSESVTKWIILGGVLGLLLFCAIVFGLYKAGFFKRAAHEKLMNEKEENLIEDTELNSSN